MFSYSLHKCRQILRHTYAEIRKSGQSLSTEKRSKIDQLMQQAEEAILAKNRGEANRLIKEIEVFSKENHLKRPLFESAMDLIGALAFALIVATIVRQVWFEPYEIPTGSMRPTLREKDRLTVSKTAFGINIPLMTDHFYFDPALVQRTSILIFSADNLDMADTEGSYFWIFPAKKRLIKRLIGKPGDAIYFYGGLLYGVDKEGHPLPELINSPWMRRFDYIPFLEFEGRITNPRPNQIIFHQMNEPIGRLTAVTLGQEKGEVFNGTSWVPDRPSSEKHTEIQTYSDIFGMGNYAMARLLTQEELTKAPNSDTKNIGDGVLYLELSHHPSLTFPRPVFFQIDHRVIPMLSTLKSIIPLQQSHLDAIMSSLYTARFDVESGKAKRYDVENAPFDANSPLFPEVPDGRYEFYFGKGEQIGWQGIPSALPSDSPLYQHTPENVQRLYNFGIDMNVKYEPFATLPNFFPHRYAYFRDGDLYLMGAPILKKGDPALTNFLEREQARAEKSTLNRPYTPFKDYGPPIKADGSYDVEKIRAFGVNVPEGHYLVLGDNHAMSADSRDFGFVPASNIQGAPSQIIWPPGDRIGPPAQKPYPFMNVPRSIIWLIALAAFLTWYIIHCRNMRKSVLK